MTLNKAAEELDLRSYIREETLLIHSGEVTGRNTMEARVIATIQLPDGTRYHAAKVIKLSFQKET